MKQIVLGNGGYALVSDEDYEELNKYYWCRNAQGYAYRVHRKKYIRMHRQIMNAPKFLEVDHIDGCKVNNQRSNLRLATHKLNCRNHSVASVKNRSGFKGVSWSKQGKKWQASITANGKSYGLGLYTDKEVAAVAYDIASLRLFGPYASTNYPLEDLVILTETHKDALYSVKQTRPTGLTSKYRGVTWDKSRGKWHAAIKIEKRQRYLGRFATEEEAARAYDDAVRQNYGDRAKCNFTTTEPTESIVDLIERIKKAKTAQLLAVCDDDAAKELYKDKPGKLKKAGNHTSQYRGVSSRANGKWLVQIYKNGRKTHLGLYDDEVEAAKVYDTVARGAFGPKATLNFPAE